MDTRVVIFIFWGLGKVASDGIIKRLAERLRQIAGVTVRTASHDAWRAEADFARALPRGTKIVAVGHSLGAVSAVFFAQVVARPVAAIFGFDAAENIGAAAGGYILPKVPANVEAAYGVFVEGIGLGGGEYQAADSAATVVENHAIDTAHTRIDEAVEKHLLIEEFVRRQAQAGTSEA